MKTHIKTITWTAFWLVLVTIFAGQCFAIDGAGIQIYLDFTTAKGNNWGPPNWYPFANEEQFIKQCVADKITIGRVMLIIPNLMSDAKVKDATGNAIGEKNYRAWDNRTVIAHLKDWESWGMRALLAPRDASMLAAGPSSCAGAIKDFYIACRVAGINPILSIYNEPSIAKSADSGTGTGKVFTESEFSSFTSAIIPSLRNAYPDMEWWAPDVHAIGWTSSYYSFIKQYAPNRIAAHLYTGSTANDIISALPKMLVYTDWAQTERVMTQFSDADKTRIVNASITNGCQYWFFWAGNTENIYQSNKRLPAWAQAVVDTIDATPVQATRTPVPVATVTQEPTNTPTRGPVKITIEYNDGTTEGIMVAPTPTPLTISMQFMDVLSNPDNYIYISEPCPDGLEGCLVRHGHYERKEGIEP